MENYPTLADIKAVAGDDANGSNWIWIIILFLFMFGNGAGGYGGGSLTRAELTEGFNNQSVINKLDGISNGLCDGFYAQNSTMLQGFNGLQNSLCQEFNGVNSSIADSRFAAQQCCCETNRNIDSLKAENYRNTCEITNAIKADGEATRALINANTMQALRDQLCDAKNDNAQYKQSQYILTQLGRYVTNPPCSPTVSCGCGCAGTTF